MCILKYTFWTEGVDSTEGHGQVQSMFSFKWNKEALDLTQVLKSAKNLATNE